MVNTVYNQIGRPYWHGYEAPSSAYYSTDLAVLQLGGGDFILTLDVPTQEFPEVLDVLVEIIPKRTINTPEINHQGNVLSIYGGALANYTVEEINLQTSNIIRIDGISKSNQFKSFTVLHKFEIPPDIVTFEQTIPLGSYWDENSDLSELRQYNVTFYTADDEVRYHLDPQKNLLQRIRDGEFSVNLDQEDSDGCVYRTVDLVRHGTTTAWLTLHKR